MTIYFEKETDGDLTFDAPKIAEKVINTALELYNCPYSVSVSLYLVEESVIQEVNLDTRGIDRITDVLSFPNIPFGKEADFSILDKKNDYYTYFDPDTDELILGEIMICQNKMIEQAASYGHSILREFAFLVTHSILHLLGYDHMEDDQRIRMEREQDIILDRLNITREDRL